MKNDPSRFGHIIQLFTVLLTAILISLFFAVLVLVGKIQGTARVVNYAGLVRGKTQLIVKLEISGTPEDALLGDMASYIEGLRFGSSELDLVRLDDADFQAKMTALSSEFDDLRNELILVRQRGYAETAIIAKSEHFFQTCDEATHLAEVYSQKRATALDFLEKVILADIVGLLLLFGYQIFKALRYAAMNRILQCKVYLDEATGLPNKNKCEELLDAPDPPDGNTALCVFDLNNLRTINNTIGHDKGDEYIRSFAEQLRLAVPSQHFVGRDGGDEFIAILYGVDWDGAQDVLRSIRAQTAEYSRQHPEMPLSYAAGCAIASDFEGSTLRELFRHADKNMYVDKNRANREEAEARKLQDQQLLHWVNAHGYQFSNCLYCDALLDQYRVLRTSSGFFLADNGSYSGAVEQIVDEYAASAARKTMREALQLSTLSAALSAEHPKQELELDFETDGVARRGRLTLLFCDADLHGRLHHFLVGFEYFRDKSTAFDERQPLTQYYEQMKHSLLENDNYVEALIDANDALFTVDLTHGQLEQIFYRTTALRQFDLQMTLPCSYDDYCAQRRHFVTPETLENYRIVDAASKLLERFRSGFKYVTVEYREQTSCGEPIWLQKTVLMAQDTVFDAASGREMPVIHGIILFRDTSIFHAQEQAENQRLQEAFEEADSASRAKTAFMNRMSHDIRTPINGILGMLDILRSNRDDARKVNSCLDKIDLSAHHLLALVNDVLDMSKLEAGQMVMEQEPFDIEVLMHDVSSLVEAQIEKDGLTHRRHRENIQHTALVGSSLKLRQIMVNLFSNAIKYNKPGGAIDTYARELSCDGTTVWYEFRITDTGIGMSRDFVENQLFKPFTQESADARTQYRGTGLGMSIVKELVSQMGGSISAESQPGEGTAFTFRLPFLLDKNAAAKPQPKPTDNGRLDGMRILLVEDNDINMEVAEFQLTSQGAAVDKAWNGREAVERFAASAPGGYQAILMDVMMPVMDGFEASRAIRALDRPDAATVPILAMTAQASDECAQSCHRVGMNGRLVKPLDAKKLAKSIREAVQNKQ